MILKPIFNSLENIYLEDSLVVMKTPIYTPNENTLHYYRFDQEIGFYKNSFTGGTDLYDSNTWGGLYKPIHYTGDTKFNRGNCFMDGSVPGDPKVRSTLKADVSSWFCPDYVVSTSLPPIPDDFTISFWLYMIKGAHYGGTIIRITSMYNLNRQIKNTGDPLMDYFWLQGSQSIFEIEMEHTTPNDIPTESVLTWFNTRGGVFNTPQSGAAPYTWYNVVVTCNFYRPGASINVATRSYINGVFSAEHLNGSSLDTGPSSENCLTILEDKTERSFDPIYHIDELIIEKGIWSDQKISDYFNNKN